MPPKEEKITPHYCVLKRGRIKDFRNKCGKT
jgi:hypothetical protein